MLEQLLHFLCVFNNPTFYTFERIIWAINYLKKIMFSLIYGPNHKFDEAEFGTYLLRLSK